MSVTETPLSLGLSLLTTRRAFLGSCVTVLTERGWSLPGAPSIKVASNADDSMSPLSSGGYSFTDLLPDEAAPRRLMLDLAALVEHGALITLSGELGAGKRTIA